MIMNGATQSAQQKWQALSANKLGQIQNSYQEFQIWEFQILGILVLGVRGYLSPRNSRIPCRILTIQNSQNFAQEFQIVFWEFQIIGILEFLAKNFFISVSILRSSCGFFIYSLKSSFISSSFWFCIIQKYERFWSLYFFKIRYIFFKNMLKLQNFLGG